MRALLVGLLAATGCATLPLQGGPRLPYEARVYLLDAEEELMTARARAQEAGREAAWAEESLQQAQVRLEGLEESALRKEAKSAVTLAQRRVELALASEDLLSARAACAEKHYAAAKERAYVRFKLEGADEGEAVRLADWADRCTAKLEKPMAAVADAEEKCARARAEQARASVEASAKAPLEHPRPWLE